jgi:hypothetical protein
MPAMSRVMSLAAGDGSCGAEGREPMVATGRRGMGLQAECSDARYQAMAAKNIKTGTRGD